jgi:hypothetical protein
LPSELEDDSERFSLDELELSLKFSELEDSLEEFPSLELDSEKFSLDVDSD